MINGIIKQAVAQNASDIHLTAGSAPVYRINGVLQKQELPPVTETALWQFAKEQSGVDLKENTGELDFACDFKICRLRVNIYRHSGKTAAAIRLIKSEVPALKSLRFCRFAQRAGAGNRPDRQRQKHNFGGAG